MLKGKRKTTSLGVSDDDFREHEKRAAERSKNFHLDTDENPPGSQCARNGLKVNGKHRQE